MENATIDCPAISTDDQAVVDFARLLEDTEIKGIGGGEGAVAWG
jgi:hypothetical protein